MVIFWIIPLKNRCGPSWERRRASVQLILTEPGRLKAMSPPPPEFFCGTSGAAPHIARLSSLPVESPLVYGITLNFISEARKLLKSVLQDRKGTHEYCTLTNQHPARLHRL
jgi:hypothetical protein